MTKQILLKIGLIVMPIIVWWSFGMLSTSFITMLIDAPRRNTRNNKEQRTIYRI